MNKLQEKLNKMTSGELFEILKGLSKDTSDAAMVVYEEAINQFELKVSDSIFISKLAILDEMV